MSSSNPFRKKGSFAPDRSSPAIDSSAAALSDEVARDESSPEPPAGAADKTKPIKKVRVLSPPPLSPDSAEWPYNSAGPASAGDSFVQSAAQAGTDPFSVGSSVMDSDHDSSAAATPPPLPLQPPSQPPLQAHDAQSPQGLSHAVPVNPFSKTLHDLENARKDDVLEHEREEEGAALKAGNNARRSLNVDTFQRLLMTGTLGSATSNDDSAVPNYHISSQPTSSNLTPSTATDDEDDRLKHAHSDPASSAKPEQSAFKSEAREDELGDSDSSRNAHAESSGKKAPPPPPSSRHGRSLTTEIKPNIPVRPAPLQRTSGDLNKALPSPPEPSHGDVESPFDREAAGKLPDWESFQSPPPAANSSKKAVPAPPPRRGHGRSESKSQTPTLASLALQSSHKAGDDDPPSVTPSRSSSVRHSMHAPAPPPPRRPQSASRRISASSPTVASFATSPLASPPASFGDGESYIGPSDDASSVRDLPHTGNVKVGAPPPPPKRNTSVRRPQSIQSVDAISRRVPRHDGSAPPPPPPRARGSSRSSLESPPRRSSIDSFVKIHPGSTNTPRSVVAEVGAENAPPAVQGKGVDILADLTALQREVDALRGKLT